MSAAPPVAVTGAGPSAAAPAASPFDIVTDDTSPTARVTGRSRTGSMDPKRRRRNNASVVGSLVALVIALAIGAIVLTVYTNDSGQPTTESGAPEAKGGTTNIEQLEEDLESLESDTPEKPAKPDADKSTTAAAARPDAPSKPAAGEQWTDASRSSIRRGEVKVKIESATIGIPRLVIAPGRFARPRSKCLSIKILLQNTNPERKLEYTSWGVRGRSGASAGVSLTDNLENRYSLQPFRGATPEGQLTTKSIYPSKSIQDVLVFQPPIDNPKVKFLRLQLPARAFGEEGTLNFQLPRQWVVAAAEDDQGQQPPGAKEPDSAPDQPAATGSPKADPEIDAPDKQAEQSGERAEEDAGEDTAAPPADAAPKTKEPPDRQKDPDDDKPDIFKDYPDLRGDDKPDDEDSGLEEKFKDRFKPPPEKKKPKTRTAPRGR